MDIDTERVDAVVLGLLYLTLHDERRAWKSFDWDAMSRLHAKGLIHDPVNKAKSVALTDEGLKEAKRLCGAHFAKPSPRPERVQYSGATVTARAADGVSGVLCRSVADGRPFFRVYANDGSFIDYAVRHEDLPVTIAADAMASFYMIGDQPVLDHSPQVLGLPPAQDGRASGA